MGEDWDDGLDDDDDDDERYEWEEKPADDGPIYPQSVPAENDWAAFLIHSHLTDERVLNEQAAAYVWRMWRIFSFELETGTLHQSLF
jgi:hypothetical protein